MAMSAATLWVDAATGFVILFVARLLMGIAQAGLFPASTRAMSVWIPLRRRAFAAGILQACMSLGGAVGAFITAQLLGIVSWPTVFAIYAIPGLIWSAWFFAWFRDQPDEHRGTNADERDLLRPETAIAKTATDLSLWHAIAGSPAVIFLCSQQFFRAAANVFWFTWCPTYLQNVHDLDPKAAGSLTSLPIIGVVVGSIAGGVVADHIFVATRSRRLSRVGTAVGATLLGVVLFGITYFIPEEQVILAVICLTLAATVVSGGNSCSYTTAMDLGGKNLAAVFGAMNMFGNFGAAVFSQVVPEWVGWKGWPAAVLLVGGSYFIGLLCWLPLNPNPKALNDEEVDYVDPANS